MPDTGLFYVVDLQSVLDEHGKIDRVAFIAVRCNACTHVTRSAATDLESIPGGTVLHCDHCGARQTVSNARLVECDHILG